MKALTPRQEQILQLIRDYIHETGYPPTRAEIAEHFGFKSPNAAEDHLRALAKKGFIDLQPGSSRGIRLLLEEPEGLPLIGKVAAGQPLLAEEHVSDHLHVDPNLFYPSADYLLRVAGMSMKDIGIHDGDLLAVHKTDQARNGQVVVARVWDEVTVKRFQKKGKIVNLVAENKDFEPIVVDLSRDELVIEGLAVGVIRNSQL